jgi:hypothetical protein
MFWIDLFVFTIVVLVVGFSVITIITTLGDDDV